MRKSPPRRVDRSRKTLAVVRLAAAWRPGRVFVGLVAIAIAGILLGLMPKAAGAEVDREETESAGWAPALGFGFGFHSQAIDGFESANGVDLEPSTGDSLLSELFNLNGTLHTPLQLDVPSKPRLFLRASVQIPLAEQLISSSSDREFEAERDFQAPGNPPTNPDFVANCPAQIEGSAGSPVDTSSCTLGLRNLVTVNAMWTAGIGVDFTLPIDRHQFHVMPALEYFGQSVQSESEIERSSSATRASDLVESSSSKGSSEILHGISPSLTLAVDVHETGPFVFSLYLGGRVAWLLSDRDVALTSSFSGSSFRLATDMDDLVAQGFGGITVRYGSP
ncbi:MAG: hypothetical protein ACX98W_05615 [bacterium]